VYKDKNMIKPFTTKARLAPSGLFLPYSPLKEITDLKWTITTQYIPIVVGVTNYVDKSIKAKTSTNKDINTPSNKKQIADGK